MAAPTRVYAKKVWANVTPEQLAAVNREVALTGTSVSDLVRDALDLYFATPKRRRAS